MKLNLRVLEVSNYYKCLLSISELLIDQEHTGTYHWPQLVTNTLRSTGQEHQEFLEQWVTWETSSGTGG